MDFVCGIDFGSHFATRQSYDKKKSHNLGIETRIVEKGQIRLVTDLARKISL
jgi:hypothetical protein